LDLHPFRQRTFKQRASIEGVGLHSGAKVRLTLAPAQADSGIVFVRTDLKPAVEIPAIAENVVDTTMNTSLGRGGVRVGTVEHLLAALAGCGIDNARLEVEGPEIPIVDGSSDPFVQLVREAGIHEQRAARRFLLVRKPVVVTDGDKVARLSPRAKGRFSVDYTIDFQHPFISTR
jgi:UDP-3-O-[3-hydroxymyristoyl] N-acetylglucosamine deacetylase